MTITRVTGKCPITDISGTAGYLPGGTHVGIGKTSVHFRFHNETKYNKLPKEQCNALRVYCDGNEKRG